MYKAVMHSLKKDFSLSDLQQFIFDVYSLPDDRLYSIWDLLVQQQRFSMRSLKGIRKGNIDKLKNNLLISLSWLIAISNRLHINVEEVVWKRFPYLCSYCGGIPCSCKAIHPRSRANVSIDNNLKPNSLEKFQEMFNRIYPESNRTLADAGVHLAEETGEMSEAIHNYLGQHLQRQFDEIKLETADFVSCVCGVANSAKINLAMELEKMYENNCHICHKSPCVCSFAEVTQLET